MLQNLEGQHNLILYNNVWLKNLLKILILSLNYEIKTKIIGNLLSKYTRNL